MADLRERADAAGIAFDEAQYQRSKPLLELQIKALIARDLWDMSEYFQVMNTENAIVQRAVQLIQ